MKLLLLVCLLIYSSIHTAQTETLHEFQTEGKIAILYCGNLTNGKVTWSRDTNGQRVDILTTHNGETTKHIADPDRRYSSQADLALIVQRVSQSDAGRYYCSGATVELSVTEETLHVSEREGNTVALKCGKLTKGPVTWSRDTNGQRVDILTTHNGETTKHIADPDRRYDSRKDLVLIIYGVSQSDAGRYYCSGATVELSVTSGTSPNSRTTSTTTTTAATTTTTSTTTSTTKRRGTKAKSTTTTTSTTKRRRKKAKSTTTTTSTTNRTITTTAEDSTTSQALWNVLIIVAVSCLVAVVLVLFSWRCFCKRKGYAVTQTQEHVYDSIDDNAPTTQPASDQQRTEEPIYYLPTYPGVQITENQQSVYEAIDPLKEHSTPQERVDQLHANMKKPTK